MIIAMAGYGAETFGMISEHWVLFSRQATTLDGQFWTVEDLQRAVQY